MKICQLCTVDFTLYHFLRPLMAGLADAGHEVVGVCADGPFADRARAEGFRVVAVPLRRSMNPLRQLAAVRALRALFVAERFDIVHVHTPVGAVVGRLAARLAGVQRVVYTAHGFYFHDRMPMPKRAVFIAMEGLLGRLTDTLFTQSEEDAATARRLHLCRDVAAIGNGSDPAVYRPGDPDQRDRTALRAALGADADRPVILMIGRLVAEKGYRELFAAMQDVDADLWVVGERLASDHAGSIEADIREVTGDPDRGRRLRLLGYRDDVPALMRAADIFVLPSHREGMPRSIIEAMLTGLPVVATDIRGCREEVVDGETGLLVPVGDAEALAASLQRLAADATLRRRLGRAGLARARAVFDERDVVQRQIAHLRLGAR